MTMRNCNRCGQEVKKDMTFCPYCGASLSRVKLEEYTVSSDDLVKRTEQLIHERNVTRTIVKNEKSEILLEMRATVGVIGTVVAPWAAALGVIAALATRCKMVEKREN